MLKIDHFIMAVNNIDHDSAYVQSLTGVLPQFGGFHKDYGTCNSIMSLSGPYFELLALDPNALDPKTRFLTIFKNIKIPKIISWAVSYNNINDVGDYLKLFNLTLSDVKDGQRELPCGSTLKYEFARVNELRESLDVFPFFIKWKTGSLHPSVSAPKGCHLKDFIITCPESNKYSKVIKDMNLGIKFQYSDEFNLNIIIDTPKGEVLF